MRLGLRRQRGVAALSALLTMVFIEVAQAAERKGTAPDLTYNVPCAGPATTPYCASRTWVDCFAYRDPRRCELVGFKGMRFPEDEHLKALANAPYPNVTGVRRVTPERFREDGAGGRISPAPELIGTHEVRIKLDICDPSVKCDAQISEFYKKVGGRWVIVSWTDNVLGCEGRQERPDLRTDCRIYIAFLKPWYD